MAIALGGAVGGRPGQRFVEDKQGLLLTSPLQKRTGPLGIPAYLALSGILDSS